MIGRNGLVARCTSVLASAGLVVAVIAVGADRAAGQDATVDEAPRLTLIDQPIAIGPNDPFPVFLAIDGAPSATRIVVDIYDRVEPGELVGMEPDDGPEATFEPIVLTDTDTDTDDPTIATRTSGFAIEVFGPGEDNPNPAWGYRIDEPGVYPVRIRLQDGADTRLAVMMTSIIRLPDDGESVPQTAAAILVEVHDPPAAAAEVRAAAASVDPTLIESLDSVLNALAERPGLPVTFSATPDTVARLARDPDAAEVLGRLRTELGGTERSLLDAPYVHLDPTSLVRAGLTGTLNQQRDLGRRTLDDLLEPPIQGTWQLQDRFDVGAVEAMRNRGILRALVPGDALARGAATLAPVDLLAGARTMRAATVSQAFEVGAAAADPALAAHRVLARLAATGPGPTGTPSVIVTIDPALASPEALRIVLDGLRIETPFFAPASIDDLLGATPDPESPRLVAPSPEDIGAYADDVRDAQTALDSYSSMVGDRNDLVLPFQRTLAVSAAVDLAPDQRRRDARSVSADLAVPFSSISIPARDKVTLGARDAQFPLPIESDLDYPVQVVIELASNDRLEFPRNRIETTLEDDRQVVDIQVRTRTSGDTPLTITLRTPDDGVILAEGRYVVRSTAVSGVGILLTVGAAGFLAIWWGRHWHRNRSRTPQV